jgi:putative transposase
LVFLDEMGIILGAGRTHARSQRGTIIHDLKPFYCGIKVTAIGAITMDKLVALMTRDEALNGQAFAVFIEQFLCPKLWQGAVVVMDNLPAHKVASIVPLIESVGASVISRSPYSPDFNPIELWWSQLKAFLRRFAPTTSSTIDRILAVALHLIEPEHLKNWFTHCCYCTS